MGFVLLISNIKQKSFFNKNLILCISLLIYISFRILIDTDYINLLKVFFYKYGILNYFILGGEFFFASKIIKKYSFKGNINLFSNLIIILSFIFSFFISVKFLGFDLDINLKNGFYKETADNAYLIGLGLISLSFFLIYPKNIFIKILSILSIFNLIINPIFTGSTSSLIYIPFLLLTSINLKNIKIFYKKNFKKEFKYLFFLLVYILVFFLITVYFSTHINDSSFDNSFLISNNSRLNINYLNNDFDDFFSPIKSRLIILESFLKQFSINPFLGNWNAEIISGTGKGYYVHSILLSSLTHIGIIGFSLLSLILFRSFKKINFRNNTQDKFLLLNFLLITIFGSFFQFITYLPFWFLMGAVNFRFKE